MTEQTRGQYTLVAVTTPPSNKHGNPVARGPVDAAQLRTSHPAREADPGAQRLNDARHLLELLIALSVSATNAVPIGGGPRAWVIALKFHGQRFGGPDRVRPTCAARREGGPSGARTQHLRIKSPLLYQMS